MISPVHIRVGLWISHKMFKWATYISGDIDCLYFQRPKVKNVPLFVILSQYYVNIARLYARERLSNAPL